MAFDDKTRGRLQKLVTACRGLLTDEFRIQVQQTYGLDPNTGDVTPLERLTHLSAAERETADLLRQTLAHYLAAEGLADSANISAPHRVPVIDRIVREQAFTVLNRLAALLMMEARGVLLPAISAGQQSKAFELYKLVAGSALGETGQAYQVFLFSLFDEFAQELPALFDRFAPQGRLFPREAALLQVLVELNHHEIQPLWGEDETIGWIYQYFNSKEERKAMRDASQAPRNSRELAVRNQFFTPRYVVEFLVDNTLGRLWFNATGGQTGLRGSCYYLVIKPDEQPAARLRLRDPRTLKLLDPACGSMHFGLYAFDVFLAIYREAWDWEQAHGAGSLDVSTSSMACLKPLCQSYSNQASYLLDVPRLVIEHNIHGVDIDPRAAQIASLALWLRAQRAWHDDDIKAKDRPIVGQGHVIAATAPPAEMELREQFTTRLNSLDAELFNRTLQLLKGVPDLGVLLQVERELPLLVREVFGEHGSLFKDADGEQWGEAEARLREALIAFAQAAKATYQGRLFAEDALQGLRLIDLCREVFDVVVMNPPFGLPTIEFQRQITADYPDSYVDIYACFLARASQLCRGWIGSITSRSLLITKKLQRLRENILLPKLDILLDLGWPVMDGATVQSAAYTLACSSSDQSEKFSAFDYRGYQDKEGALRLAFVQGSLSATPKSVEKRTIAKYPRQKVLHSLPVEIAELFSSNCALKPDLLSVKKGMATFGDFRFLRLRWECQASEIGRNKKWVPIAKGGTFARFWSNLPVVVNWANDGAEVCECNRQINGQTAQARQASNFYYTAGGTYSRRSKNFGIRALPAGFIIGEKGPAVLAAADVDPLFPIGILNSRLVNCLVNLQANAKQYDTGIVESIPLARFGDGERSQIIEAVEFAIKKRRQLHSTDEVDNLFSGLPKGADLNDVASKIEFMKGSTIAAEREALRTLDIIVDRCYEIDSSLLPALIEGESEIEEDQPNDEDEVQVDADNTRSDLAHRYLSYLFGLMFRRWSLPADKFTKTSLPQDILGELPGASPARLPLSSAKAIIELDSSNPAKFLAEYRNKIQELFDGDSDFVENDLMAALSIGSTIEFFARPNGFFARHLIAYTESRRQAPIYWPLATTSNSYTVWIYYPSLNSQTLYTAINDFVEPKLKQVSDDVAALRNKGSGRKRDDEKQFEALQGLEAELLELRDKLQEIAPGYKPNHDDGVQITAAPLWPLFRHKPWQKILKDTWAKLEKGDYDWAHLAMAYWPERVREKCKTDKSLAIAHDLEDLYVEPAAAPKKTRGRKKADT